MWFVRHVHSRMLTFLSLINSPLLCAVTFVKGPCISVGIIFEEG